MAQRDSKTVGSTFICRLRPTPRRYYQRFVDAGGDDAGNVRLYEDRSGAIATTKWGDFRLKPYDVAGDFSFDVVDHDGGVIGTLVGDHERHMRSFSVRDRSAAPVFEMKPSQNFEVVDEVETKNAPRIWCDYELRRPGGHLVGSIERRLHVIRKSWFSKKRGISHVLRFHDADGALPDERLLASSLAALAAAIGDPRDRGAGTFPL